MNEKEITIKVPEGKRAEWINGVLTLVDEPKKDDRPVTERIKTFEDALDELEIRAANGDSTAEMLYDDWHNVTTDSDDLIAYLQLRIIIAALNEGWEPQFTKGETRWYFWFTLITKEEYDKLPNEDKDRCVCLSSYYANAYGGLSCAYAIFAFSSSNAYCGARLAFRTRELAEYAGIQFIQEFVDFVFKPRSCEDLNGKSESNKYTLLNFSENE